MMLVCQSFDAVVVVEGVVLILGFAIEIQMLDEVVTLQKGRCADQR
jgi:hypothetical protein